MVFCELEKEISCVNLNTENDAPDDESDTRADGRVSYFVLLPLS